MKTGIEKDGFANRLIFYARFSASDAKMSATSSICLNDTKKELCSSEKSLTATAPFFLFT